MTATLPKGKANIWGVRKKTREQGMYDLDRMFSAQSAVHSAADEVMDILDVPVIAKPVDGGSSVRLSLLRDQAEVAAAVNEDVFTACQEVPAAANES